MHYCASAASPQRLFLLAALAVAVLCGFDARSQVTNSATLTIQVALSLTNCGAGYYQLGK